MLYFGEKFNNFFLWLISHASHSSPLHEGFSHLGFGWCVSIMGCMIRPGRLVILASSRERHDIYFSNPRPWGWKMHVWSLAKEVWVIIYASVSSPTPDLTGGVSDRWCMICHPLPCVCPHRIQTNPKRTLSVCPSFDKHPSSSNLDTKSAPLPRLLTPPSP